MFTQTEPEEKKYFFAQKDYNSLNNTLHKTRKICFRTTLPKEMKINNCDTI